MTLAYCNYNFCGDIYPTLKIFGRKKIQKFNMHFRYFQELAQDLKDQWWKCIKSDHGIIEASMNFDQLINLFKKLKIDSVNYLLDEICLDTQNDLAEILTPEWARSEDMTHNAIDTLVVTLTDYFKDYIHLKTDICKLLTNLCQERIAKNYIVSLLQPRTLLSKRITIETGKKKHVVPLKSRTNFQF